MEDKVRKNSKNRGITLIALIITIIILLILAGIVLNLIFGDKGLLDHAKRAKFETDFRTVEEAMNLMQANKEIAEILNEKVEEKIIGVELSSHEKTKIATLQEIVEELRQKEIAQVPLYWINTEELKVKVSHQYIIDGQTGQIYDYQGEKYYGKYHHTLEEKQEKSSWIPDPTPNDISDLKIYTIEDLVRLSNAVSAGETFTGKTIEVMNDLDFKSEASYHNPQTTEFGDVNKDTIEEPLIVELSKEDGFMPIGIYDVSSYSNTIETPFKGIFDGKNHTIANLYQKKTEGYRSLGLFGFIEEGTIANLALTEVEITNTYQTGGIIGRLEATETLIQNCSITGRIESNNSYVGGIIGNSDTILQMKQCSNGAEIIGSNIVGGLLGINQQAISIIEDCSNIGNIKANSNVGGLVGIVATNTEMQSFQRCSNTGKIEGASVGGLIGQYPEGIIHEMKDCSNTGEIVSPSRAGGLMGETYGITISNMQNCNNQGKITSTGNQAAGCIPQVKSIGSIQDCYNTGNIIGESDAGGIIGKCNNSIERVTNCYNIGEISSKGYNGGLIGAVEGSITTMKQCYNEGNLIKSSSATGGLVGYVFTMQALENSYSKGRIDEGNNNYKGGLIGNVSNIIEEITNCFNEMEVKGKNNSGGIIGLAGKIGKIENTHNRGSILGNEAGGLIGYSTGTIGNVVNCSNSGNVQSTGEVGGLVSICRDKITSIRDFHNEGTITGENHAGGMIGEQGTEIEEVIKCSNTGTITGTNNTGGLLGYMPRAINTLENCYNAGKIEGNIAGGIIGHYLGLNNANNKLSNIGEIKGGIVGGIFGRVIGNNGSIQNLYNTGEIIGISNTQYVGGIVGDLMDTELKNVYNIGVIKGDGIKGQLLGSATINNVKISSAYYSTEGVAIGKVVGQGNEPETTLKTVENMKTDEFLHLLDPTGTIWKRDDTQNGGLPELIF